MDFLSLAGILIVLGIISIFIRRDYNDKDGEYTLRHQEVLGIIEEYCDSKSLFKEAKKQFAWRVTITGIYEFTKHKSFQKMPEYGRDRLIDSIILLKKTHDERNEADVTADRLLYFAIGSFAYSFVTILYYVVN